MRHLHKILSTAAAVLISFSLSAQPGPPVDPDVPISGIEWLLLAGGALGARKILKKLRKE